MKAVRLFLILACLMYASPNAQPSKTFSKQEAIQDFEYVKNAVESAHYDPYAGPDSDTEGAARVAAASIIADLHAGERPPAYAGVGTCYVEFAANRVGRVDIDLFSGPSPTGSFVEPSVAIVAEKEQFGSSRRARCFGVSPRRSLTTISARGASGLRDIPPTCRLRAPSETV